MLSQEDEGLIMDLNTFKEQIRQKLNESSFENKELYTKWRQIMNEQDDLQHLYRPRNKLTFRGFVKICPNDGTKLIHSIVAREWGLFGLWEYIILSCPTCGYEYAMCYEQKHQE